MSLELKNISEYKQVLWLIKLRWLAVGGLIIIVPVTIIFLNISLHYIAIFCIALFLIFENVLLLLLLKWILKRYKDYIQLISNKIINVQISIDFLVLTVLLHYTGGVENPFIIYYIFHMVLASILLGPDDSYLQTFFALILVGSLTFLEYYEIIPHYELKGFIKPYLFNNSTYLLGTGLVFITTSFLVVYLTCSISAQLKREREELLQLNTKLKQKDSVKNEYILRVSHDIRGHLSAVITNLSVVITGITGEMDKKQSKFINVAYSRTIQLVNFVNDLLKLTKLRLDNKSEGKEFLFSDVVKKSIKTVSEDADTKSISVICSIEPLIGNIYGEEVSIEALITNLLSNAVKYTPEKGKVEINVKDKEKNILLEIKDTGFGIPEGELDKVFDEFYRATNIKENIRDGTGIGLTIVKEIVNRHNGKIWVESEEGKGTKFSILLPKYNN